MHLEDYTTGDLKKQLLTMAVPVSVGLFFNTMFNVVDTYWAGRLGTSSLAGMSLSFSVFFILIAIIGGLGTGLSALLAISYGKRDEAGVRALTVNGLALTLAVGVVIGILGYIISPKLLALLGAEGDTLLQGTYYVRGIYAGTIFFALNSALNALLSSRGITKPYRNYLIVGFFINLILDPMFIYGSFGLPRMGTFGVALATVVVQILGNVYLIYKCVKMLELDASIFKRAGIQLKMQLEILSQGIPASLNMLTMALGIFVINYFIYKHGDDAAIAGYGVAMRIEQLALLPAIGLNTAVVTLAGQNYGAKNIKRVRLTYTEGLKLGMIIMTVGMIIIFPLASVLIGAFNQDRQVIFEGARYLRIEFIAFNGYIILNIGLSVLQAIKKPHYAIWIGLYRQIAMPILLFTLFGEVFGWGLIGIWWGIVTTVWTGAFACILAASHELKKLQNDN